MGVSAAGTRLWNWLVERRQKKKKSVFPQFNEITKQMEKEGMEHAARVLEELSGRFTSAQSQLKLKEWYDETANFYAKLSQPI